MAFDTSKLADYSWADIAKAAKAAMLTAAIGGTRLVQINGNDITRMTQDQLESLYNFAMEQQNAESEVDGGDIALVRFGQS